MLRPESWSRLTGGSPVRVGTGAPGSGPRLVAERRRADLNPLLRGRGNYFRTGNAAVKFRQAGDYVVWRLRRLMIAKRGRNLRAGQVQAWTQDWFNGNGLYRLRGKVRYPRAA